MMMMKRKGLFLEAVEEELGGVWGDDGIGLFEIGEEVVLVGEG